MNKLLILVTEDDAPVRNLITTTLRANDYRYITADTGEGAVAEAASRNPDIIVISARSEDSDKINALDAGADDYLTKPFSVEELLARLRVTQRRLALMAESQPRQSVYENGPLRIDFVSGCAFLNEEELHLTPIEYRLLSLLAANTGKVLTHRYILQKVWGSSWENDVGSLRVYMATLRRKLEKSPDAPRFIQTHIGIGYRMMKLE